MSSGSPGPTDPYIDRKKAGVRPKLPREYTWNSVRYKGKGVAFLQILVFSDYRRFTSRRTVQFDDPNSEGIGGEDVARKLTQA